VEHDTCGAPVHDDAGRAAPSPCARWKDHPGQHEFDIGRADQADHDDAMRMRLVEASERQADALEAMTSAVEHGVELVLNRLEDVLALLEPDE
jgi:hypothetical protein